MGGTVEIVRELPSPWQHACLIKQNDSYFIVSTVIASYTGLETLIFHANVDGEVEEWMEVGGGRGIERAEAIADFEKHGPYELHKYDEKDDD